MFSGGGGWGGCSADGKEEDREDSRGGEERGVAGGEGGLEDFGLKVHVPGRDRDGPCLSQLAILFQ